MTDSSPTTLFPESMDSEWLFVSDSPRFTRAAIHHAMTMDTATHFGLTDALIRKLRRDRLTASRLQQLLDDETARVTGIDADRIETVVVTDGELRLATPGIADHTDSPVAIIDTDNQTTDLATAYEQRVAAGAPVTDRFADVGWRDVLTAAAESFDEEFRNTLEAATDTTTIRPESERNSLVGILCLVAAHQERTQKALCRFTEAQGLASTGTITNMAGDLEAAGRIEREPVDVDRRGRPPKRLLLADEMLDPTDFVSRLPE